MIAELKRYVLPSVTGSTAVLVDCKTCAIGRSKIRKGEEERLAMLGIQVVYAIARRAMTISRGPWSLSEVSWTPSRGPRALSPGPYDS